MEKTQTSNLLRVDQAGRTLQGRIKKIGTKISGLSDSNSRKMTPRLTEKIQAQQGTHESEPFGRSDPKQIDEKLSH
jgi:hypothetical protein